MAEAGERQRTLGDNATFMCPLNFNSIARPTIAEPNMEMKHAPYTFGAEQPIPWVVSRKPI